MVTEVEPSRVPTVCRQRSWVSGGPFPVESGSDVDKGRLSSNSPNRGLSRDDLGGPRGDSDPGSFGPGSEGKVCR